MKKQIQIRMEAEHITRLDVEEVKIFLQRTKIVVGKRWPDDLADVAQNDRNVKRTARDRQSRQRCNFYSVRGLRRQKLREKAHEYLMEHLDATWEQFSQAVTNKVLSYTKAVEKTIDLDATGRKQNGHSVLRLLQDKLAHA